MRVACCRRPVFSTISLGYPSCHCPSELNNRSKEAHLWHTKRCRKTNLRGVLKLVPLIGPNQLPPIRLGTSAREHDFSGCTGMR